MAKNELKDTVNSAESIEIEKPAREVTQAEYEFMIFSKFSDERLQQLRSMIDELPQSDYLDTARVNRWLARVLDIEPQRVEWHIKRLGGLGGSEMGAVVAPSQGEYNPFKLPKDVFADKLMLTVPEHPSGDIKRGVFMEPVIQARFLESFGARSMTEHLEKFPAFSDPAHPWLVGNPDDIVMIGNKVYLVDYKSPREVVDVLFDYEVQLHHYTAIATKLGIQIDGLLLVAWDYVAWDCSVKHVELKPELMNVIIEEGDRLWFEHILENKPPFAVKKPKIELKNEVDPASYELRTLIEQASLLSVVSNNAAEQVKEVKAKIADLVSNRHIGDAKLVYGVVNVTTKDAVDEDKMALLMQKHMINPSDVMKQGNINLDILVAKAMEKGVDIDECREMVIDNELAADKLWEVGVSPEEFTDASVSVALARSKKGEKAEVLTNLKITAKKYVENFIIENQGLYLAGDEIKLNESLNGSGKNVQPYSSVGKNLKSSNGENIMLPPKVSKAAAEIKLESNTPVKEAEIIVTAQIASSESDEGFEEVVEKVDQIAENLMQASKPRPSMLRRF